MNWIERMYEIKNKDLYSQSGEGLLLEYVFSHIGERYGSFIDIGGGDGFYLSNTKHLANLEGWYGTVLDYENGIFLTLENLTDYLNQNEPYDLISIDVDGNDYWFLDVILPKYKPAVIIAEFNAMYTDSRTIKYNADHIWAGDSYYGFTFDAGVKLAERHGYKVIFQVADMNMIMVRADLVDGLSIPPVTYKQNDFFQMSGRPDSDWVWI